MADLDLDTLRAKAGEALDAFKCDCTGRCQDREESPAGVADCASVVARTIAREIKEALK